MNQIIRKRTFTSIVGALLGTLPCTIAGVSGVEKALGHDNHVVVQNWLRQGGDPNKRGLFRPSNIVMPVAGIAIATNDDALLRLLLENGADPNGTWLARNSTETGSLLEYAAKQRHDAAAMMLVDYGADPTPLKLERWYTHPNEFPVLKQKHVPRFVDRLVQRYHDRMGALGEVQERITADPMHLMMKDFAGLPWEQ